MSTHDVSRRGFIGGAAGAGALSAALAALGLEGVANADDNGTGTTSGESGGTFSSQALPTITAPGVRVGVIGFTDTLALSNTSAAALQYSQSGVFNSSGWLNASLDLPVGARLVRLDVFAKTDGSPTSISVKLDVSAIGGANSVVATLTTPPTPGVVQAAYTPATPLTVGLGERLYLETADCNSVSKVFLGAIFQYYDANPQLNLLPVPIRIYDSRAGANPTTVVKGALANSNTRVIDCTVGGAVPPGAAAAMITLTLVGTSAAGYMALFRNGEADPGTSSVNWDHSGTNVAVTTVVAVDGTAKLMAKTGPSASTDFIIDVIGFYA